jgi:hypothetical protein
MISRQTTTSEKVEQKQRKKLFSCEFCSGETKAPLFVFLGDKIRNFEKKFFLKFFPQKGLGGRQQVQKANE